MMNTKISYMYRDADNYKAYRHEVLRGTLTAAQIAFLFDKAGEGNIEGFIPSQVGLPDLQVELMSYDSAYGEEGYDPFGAGGSDHVWHEITKIEQINEEVTTKVSAGQFFKAFAAAAKKGWDVQAAEKAVGF